MATMNGATAVNFISRFIAWLADAMRDYGDVVSSRATWREKINALEAELETLTDELSQSIYFQGKPLERNSGGF